MARTGLRMMPTFPSPHLKFRTAGFPRYGFKASISSEAFPTRFQVKPAPGIPVPRLSLLRFSHASAPSHFSLALRPEQPRLPRAAVGEESSPRPQGPLAPVRVMLSRSITAYYDPIRQSRRHATTSRHGRLYVTPSLCGSARGDPRDLPDFRCRPFTACRQPLRRWVRSPLPLTTKERSQASSR